MRRPHGRIDEDHHARPGLEQRAPRLRHRPRPADIGGELARTRHALGVRDSGASISVTPFAASSAASRAVTSGSDVLESITVSPGFAAGTIAAERRLDLRPTR